MLPRVAFLALMGGTLGTLLDRVHVVTGTTAYPPGGEISGQPWWVPLEFAGASLLIGLSHPALDRLLGRRTTRGLGTRALLLGQAALITIWIASGLLNRAVVLDTVLIAAASVFVWWAFDRTRQGAVMAAGTGMGGCLVEWTFATHGVFRYVAPNLGPIASWLPFLYATASVTVGNVGRRLVVQQPSRSA